MTNGVPDAAKVTPRPRARMRMVVVIAVTCVLAVDGAGFLIFIPRSPVKMTSLICRHGGRIESIAMHSSIFPSGEGKAPVTVVVDQNSNPVLFDDITEAIGSCRIAKQGVPIEALTAEQWSFTVKTRSGLGEVISFKGHIAGSRAMFSAPNGFGYEGSDPRWKQIHSELQRLFDEKARSS